MKPDGSSSPDSGLRSGRADAGLTTPTMPASLRGILVLSLALNLWGIWFGLPDSWHPDELVSRSVAMARNFTLQPPSYLYGSMHYYVLLAVITPTYLVSELLSLPVDMQKTLVYLAARALSAALGTGCVVLTYLLARTLFDQTAALIAALLLAISVGLVNIAHFATVDVPMLFWMLAAYLMSARVLNGAGVRGYLLAGAFAGLAAGTKYVGGIALLALVLAYLLRERDRNVKHLFLGIIASAGAFILVNLPALFASCAFFEGFILDNAFNTAVRTEFDGPAAMLILHGVVDALGTSVFVIAVLALMYAALRALKKKEVRQIVFLASTLVMFFLVLINIHYASIRHVLPMTPPLLILTGKMISDLINRPTAWRLRRGVGYGVLALAVVFSAIYMLSIQLQFTFDARNLATAWIMAHAAPGSTIEVTPYGPSLPDARFVVQERPYLPNLDSTIEGLRNTAVYRGLYPIYLRYKSVAESIGLCETRVRHYRGWYETARAAGSRELATFDPTIAGLQARGPDLLIVSSFYYDRFIDDPTGPDGRFFKRLFEDGGGYRQVAEFHYGLLPWPDPVLEFINPTVRIYRKQPVNSEEGSGSSP